MFTFRIYRNISVTPEAVVRRGKEKRESVRLIFGRGLPGVRQSNHMSRGAVICCGLGRRGMRANEGVGRAGV